MSNNPKDSDLKLPAPLRTYQKRGVAFLAERDNALLADQMGLGKTVQTAVALQLLFISQGWFRALIICPASLRLNWQRELRKWSPQLSTRRVVGSIEERAKLYRLPVQVLIASFEQMRVDAIRLHPDVRFDVVILDEAQRIKNIDSATNLACRLLPRSKSWALTGTPIENKPEDLVAIYRFVKSNLLQKGLTRKEIHKRIRNHFLRRKKSQVLRELPPIQIQEIELELRGSQRDAYQDVWQSRAELAQKENEKYSSAGLLGVITRLKQLCNYDPLTGESAKYEILALMLEELSASGEKMLIFSQYVRTLEWLSDQISVPHDIFHGQLSEREKENAIDLFQTRDGPRILLVSLKAGGTGLNLQAAATVVLFDRWWNPAVEQQAIERAHRFGRKRPLHVIKFLVIDSIEERIVDILEHKGAIIKEYIEMAPDASLSSASANNLRSILQLPMTS